MLHAELPVEIVPKGLSLERQWYLYKNIRVLCHSNLGRDMISPYLSQAKPKGTSKDNPADSARNSAHQSEGSSTTSSTATFSLTHVGSKRRLCSICSNPGHNKKTCPERKLN